MELARFAERGRSFDDIGERHRHAGHYIDIFVVNGAADLPSLDLRPRQDREAHEEDGQDEQ
jgi:hypothetical protein